MISFCGGDNVLELEYGNGCTTLEIYWKHSILEKDGFYGMNYILV